MAVRPHPEARQCGGAESGADRDVGCVAAPGNEYPPDARRVVAGVEGVPMAVEKCLEPGREIHRSVRRRHTDVAEVAGAVARRDVHAPAEGNGEVRIIATDSRPVVVGLERRPGHSRVVIAEGDVPVDIVADRLDAVPSRWHLLEEIPRNLGQPIGFAIPASQQKEQGVVGQVRHRNLLRLGNDHVGHPGIVHDRIDGNAHSPLRRDDAGAPVAEAVAIGCDRNRRVEHQGLTADEVGNAREVDVAR